MRDIGFDFKKNDIEFLGGDFRIINSCSQQNATLMAAKSVVNILLPQFGAGIQERYYWVNSKNIGILLSKATRQTYTDGAQYCYMRAEPNEQLGQYDIYIDVMYKSEAWKNTNLTNE